MRPYKGRSEQAKFLMEAFARAQKEVRGEGPVTISEANIFVADSDAEIRLPSIIQLGDVQPSEASSHKASPIKRQKLKLTKDESQKQAPIVLRTEQITLPEVPVQKGRKV